MPPSAYLMVNNNGYNVSAAAVLPLRTVSTVSLVPPIALLKCECNTGTESCRQNFCTVNNPARCYYVANFSDDGHIHNEKYGCTGQAHLCPDDRPFPNTTIKNGYIRLCCKNAESCNLKEFRHIAWIHAQKIPQKPPQNPNYWPYVVALIVFVVIFLGFYLGYKIFDGVRHSALEDDFAQDSGTLLERTAGYDIVVDQRKRLGGGSFGWVYSSTYKGDSVAVKVFEPENLSWFELEKQIYKKFRMSPDYILRFIFADLKIIDGLTKGILVTELCELGSLQGLLKRKRPPFTCTVDECIGMSLDIAKGLDFLHRRIISIDRIEKLEIVHRDLKSSNILVRKGNRCVIGDFGFSVVEDLQQRGDGGVDRKIPSTSPATPPGADANSPPAEDTSDCGCCFGGTVATGSFDCWQNPKRSGLSLATAEQRLTFLDETRTTEYRNQEFIVGTKRYMAPELMTGKINVFNFEAYKQTDIYSFGLILWEIRSRTIINGVKPLSPYISPYEEYESLRQDENWKGVDFMKQLVAIDKKRPTFSYCYNDRKIMRLEALITECWSPKPENRPVAYKCKRTLSALV